MKQNKEATVNKNILDAFTNAFNGIWYAIKTQRNIKIQLLVSIVVIIAGFVFKLSKIEFIFLVFSCGLVLITETVNTAIEATVNLCTDKYHPIAKIAKDVGAGAVVISSINAIIVGCILFIDKIF